ncbi:response regulator (plasmid) [Pedobacter sp. BS3]|uniref:two-component regulator propeller domain-containing protein n=1 Tax=Pedobacter sp. BS3 TaxID=2567937 RepID=UPI0011F006AE|nr:two-component regulator propeller domain-containing protein [Pedobacter sp. BS3]TZF86104.1 response regulator [Pedobacter sp. BS3]
MKKTWRYIGFSILLAFSGLQTRAVPATDTLTKRYFRNISIEQGLSQSTVFSIAQDTLGFMWIGTQDGLNRYDGETFTVYRPVKNNKYSLQSNYIRAIYLDNKGLLWIGGNMGISRYDYATDRFVNYRLPRKPGEWYVTSIVQDVRQQIWASSSSGEIFYLDTQTNQFKQVNFNASAHNIRSVRLLLLWQNTLLAGTDVGLFKMDAKTHQLSDVFLSNEKPMINDLFPDGKTLWIGTEGNGLFVYDTASGKLVNYRHARTDNSSIADNDVRSIKKDNEGNIWVGTFRGLSVYDSKSQTFQSYYHQSSIPYTISQNSVRYIYRDKQDGMWLGTFYGGVNYYHASDIKFNLLNQNAGRLSLNDQVINVIKQDAKGNFWIGTNDKGLDYWDRQTNAITYYAYNEAKPNSLSSNNVKAIIFDGDNVLVGTHNAGLNCFNPRTGKNTIYRYAANQPDGIAGDMVYALLKDHQGRIWVGTRTGLDQFNSREHTFKHIYIDKAGKRLTSDEITYLTEDSQGRIWIGTTNGVNIFYPDNMLFEPISSEALSDDVVNCIAEDTKNRIWVGTRNGLNLFDEASRSFITPAHRHDFLKGTIYGILSDNDGNLWISTNKGLARFNPDTHQTQTFDHRDGLQNNQFNLYAFCKASDGMMLFGGINGISYFYPQLLKQNIFKLKVTFTGLEVFNKPVIPSDQYNVLDRHIDQAQQLRFKPDLQQFTIFFNTFNYISPNKIKYQYKLAGFDREWQVTENIPKAAYSNLKPGRYVFYVRAVGPSGEMSPERSLNIEILPPWWNSSWFYSLIVLLVLATIYVAYKVISERIKTRHQLKLERLEREKVDYVNQMKMEFFTNVSHEFRTPLTLILAPLEEIMSKPVTDKALRKQHELIMLNAKRLFYLVDELLEFRKTELGTKKLKVSRGDMVSFIHEVYLSFATLSDKNNINYTFRSTEAKLSFWFDKDSLEKICFNLLSNAFKYTQPGGSIAIKLAKKQGFAVITVSDTGIGIDPKYQSQIFERFYQVNDHTMNIGSGVGLALTKRLVELHHGTIDVESTPGEGTLFRVAIPLAEDSYTYDEHQDEQSYELTIRNGVETDIPADDLPDWQELVTTEPHTEKLLIVDDNKEIIDYLQKYFSKNYIVLTAANGKEALMLVESETVDMIICDIMMPELDGIHFCKKIKQNIQTCHIPVILLTAKSETRQQIEGLEVGADDYVTKPFSINLLDAKVHNIIRSRKRLKEYYSNTKEVVPENITFNTLDEEFIREAITIIENHITESDFSVDKFSREIGMSRSNLYLKLKAITGESATDFIKRIRFKKAVELLESRRYTISQVAYMSGFNSPSYFSTCFKQYYDCMPTEYLARKKADGEAMG